MIDDCCLSLKPTVSSSITPEQEQWSTWCIDYAAVSTSATLKDMGALDP